MAEGKGLSSLRCGVPLRYTEPSCRVLIRVNSWTIIKIFLKMAEGKGFEPSKACTLHAFQACSFNHSDTPLYEAYEFYRIFLKSSSSVVKNSKILCCISDVSSSFCVHTTKRCNFSISTLSKKRRTSLSS